MKKPLSAVQLHTLRRIKKQGSMRSRIRCPGLGRPPWGPWRWVEVPYAPGPNTRTLRSLHRRGFVRFEDSGLSDWGVPHEKIVLTEKGEEAIR